MAVLWLAGAMGTTYPYIRGTPSPSWKYIDKCDDGKRSGRRVTEAPDGHAPILGT